MRIDFDQMPWPRLDPVRRRCKPATIAVDCNTGGTIASALIAAKPGDTVLVGGTCMESVSGPRHLVDSTATDPVTALHYERVTK